MVVEAPGTTNTALVYRFLFDKKGHFFSFANKNDNEEGCDTNTGIVNNKINSP